MEKQSCCFIGHRDIEDAEAVFLSTKRVVEELIEQGVRVFNFGGRSDFNDICYKIVLELEKEYPYIKRVKYNVTTEYVFYKEDKEKIIKMRCPNLSYYDESKISERVKKAGRASYVERNQDMINDSDFCVFFYNEGYKPLKNPYHQSNGKSGTAVAFEYAKRKKKDIINIAKIM